MVSATFSFRHNTLGTSNNNAARPWKQKASARQQEMAMAVLIVFATFLGSVLYLVCHPQIFFSHGEDEEKP